MTLDDRLRPLLLERARSLFRNLPGALAGEEEPVHQVRVASRRLRVAIPLLARKPQGRRVRRALRVLKDLTRTAGLARDLDVCVALFEEKAGARARSVPEVVVLRRRLRAARGRARARTADALFDLDLGRLRRDLRSLTGRGPESLFTVLVRLRRARDVEGKGAQEALARLGGRFDPAALHDLRRRARRLRYAAEVGAALREEAAGAPRIFKQVQEALGRVHDAWLLAGWLGRQAAASERKGAAPLASAALDLQAEALELSRAHHRAFLEGSPEALLAQALSGMGRSDSAA